MEARVVSSEGAAGLHLLSQYGDKRLLSDDLYSKLADISDTYHSTKNYIGYVDPSVGVVLVDASRLTKDTSVGSSSSRAALGVQDTSSTDIPDVHLHDVQSSTVQEDHMVHDLEESSPIISSPEKLQDNKTMHQLAYENKNMGRHLPDDETRPISGFAVRNGVVHLNSSTFNSFSDAFHADSRTMGSVETGLLTALFDRLNKLENKKSSVCVIA